MFLNNVVLGKPVYFKLVFQCTYFALGCNTCTVSLAGARSVSRDTRTWLKHPVVGHQLTVPLKASRKQKYNRQTESQEDPGGEIKVT